MIEWLASSKLEITWKEADLQKKLLLKLETFKII
jgi:hypothetical protein